MASVDLEMAMELALGAGRILSDGFERLGSIEVGYKSMRDPVTEIDRASEEFIRARIASTWPDDGFLGEEGGGDTRPDRVWIVDPLDGTVNFMRGHTVFCVSVALCERGVVTAGVVHAPVMNQTFSAARGEGAWKGSKRLSVSRTGDLGKAVLATGFAYDRSETHMNNHQNFERLSLKTTGIRRMGSAALDLAWVAEGIFDGFWELGLSPWDLAAGSLLVEEAGGRVTDFSMGSGWLYGKNILATNGALHAAVADLLDPFGRRGP